MKCLYFIKQNKFIILVILLFLIVIFLNLYNSQNKEEVLLENELENEEKFEEIIVDTIKVDIKGAVNNPGVYELNNNSRVSDVINLSGGLTDSADTSTINLSKILKDEMVIIIYTKKEIEEMKKEETKIKYIEKECICPKLENDACIEESTNNELENNIKQEDELNTKISLNTATISELMTLSGIGESKAKDIIEYREKNNGFKSIDEIKNVSGIGDSIYEKIKDSISI